MPSPWEYHPHPEVWLLLAVSALAYWWAVTNLRPASASPVKRGQVACWGLGLLTIWAASDYPIHDIAEHYLFSVHMVQHLMITLVAPPLLLLGMPEWLQHRLFVSPAAVHAVLRKLTYPLVAALLYNATTVWSHWPNVVDAALESHPLHFLVHFALFATAMIMWIPALNHLPQLSNMSPPARMVYLFLQSVVPTVPASFITFAKKPLYSFYENAPRAFDFSVVDDQQLAGALMKVVGGAILWFAIIVMFFRWYTSEHSPMRKDRLTWQEVERELARSNPPA